jgi:Mlo family
MASGSAGDGEEAFEVATWRVVTLFLLILAIDGAVELFDEFVTHKLHNRKHQGLSHAWQQLKFETMALGVVSLLLVVFEVRFHDALYKWMRFAAGAAGTCVSPAG